jgi:predicted MPP superfamily phosphohydrolase
VSREQVTCAAVLSDVHGNAVALEAVLEELSEESGELIVFGGDLTWGPLPEETLAHVVDLLLSPATRSEVIEDAERREFAR